jgi:hypothetical protein
VESTGLPVVVFLMPPKLRASPLLARSTMAAKLQRKVDIFIAMPFAVFVFAS